MGYLFRSSSGIKRSVQVMSLQAVFMMTGGFISAAEYLKGYIWFR